MRIALACPASLPATQFGGILFLSIHIANYLSNHGIRIHDILPGSITLDNGISLGLNKGLPISSST